MIKIKDLLKVVFGFGLGVASHDLFYHYDFPIDRITHGWIIGFMIAGVAIIGLIIARRMNVLDKDRR